MIHILIRKHLCQTLADVTILTLIRFWCLTSAFWFCFRRISHKRDDDLFNWLTKCRLSISFIVYIATHLCGTKLWPSSLKLSDRCKHVHAVVHVDLLYTVKNGTEDTAQRSSISVWRYPWELTPYCSEIIVAWLQPNVICCTLCSPESRLFNQILDLMNIVTTLIFYYNSMSICMFWISEH